jgi:hypothetical protein
MLIFNSYNNLSNGNGYGHAGCDGRKRGGEKDKIKTK